MCNCGTPLFFCKPENLNPREDRLSVYLESRRWWFPRWGEKRLVSYPREQHGEGRVLPEAVIIWDEVSLLQQLFRGVLEGESDLIRASSLSPSRDDLQSPEPVTVAVA